MADSPTVDNGALADYVVSSDEVTIDGTLGQVQRVKIVDGANAGTGLVGADAANGLDVDVTRLPALVAGSANIGDVDIASAPTGASAIEVQGTAAIDAAVVGDPIYIGGRSSDAVPTAVSADGEMVAAWFSRRGALIVSNAPHVALDGAPFTLTSKTVQTTTTQTGSDIWSPTSGKKLVITSIQIQVGGTTAGTVQVWFGLTADTTYSRGTDLAIFDGEFAPSATLKPGWSAQGCWVGPAVDSELHLTTSAAINPLTVTVWGYEI